MKDKVAPLARGVLLITLILGIPALLFASYRLVTVLSRSASQSEYPMSIVLVGLVWLLVPIACVGLCIYGIRRVVRSRQGLNLGGALVFIVALSLIWLLAVGLRQPMGRLTVTVKYQLGQRDFREIDLSRVNLAGANLREADLSSATLSAANLAGADLSRAIMNGANLQGAHLNGANLQGVDLRNANLIDAHLRNADLSSADLTGALGAHNLTGVQSLQGATMPDGTIHE